MFIMGPEGHIIFETFVDHMSLESREIEGFVNLMKVKE